jgi:hypothetical protein
VQNGKHEKYSTTESTDITVNAKSGNVHVQISGLPFFLFPLFFLGKEWVHTIAIDLPCIFPMATESNSPPRCGRVSYKVAPTLFV